MDFGRFQVNLLKFLKKCKKINLTEFLEDGGGRGETRDLTQPLQIHIHQHFYNFKTFVS